MKFIDETVIFVEAGNGGPGARSFHREKYVPYGGPDGGNGGRGGSVILKADRNKTTLLDFHFQPRWKAKDGEPGMDGNKDGRAGTDLIMSVPVGTQVFKENDPDNLVCDLAADQQEFVLAQGGRGGKGNNFFKSPTNQAPEHFQPGEKGISGKFLFSLKLVADVGLLGFPNAGKSTLISRISSAKPKIADYPFTTLTPQLGVVKGYGSQSFVVADIPGLIPGASAGKGLGIKFLKHVERTKLLAHLIDPLQIDENGERILPLEALRIINQELESFSPELAKRPQVVALTKIDCLTPEQLQELEFHKRKIEQQGYKTVAISSVAGAGLPDLISLLSNSLFGKVPRDGAKTVNLNPNHADNNH